MQFTRYGIPRTVVWLAFCFFPELDPDFAFLEFPSHLRDYYLQYNVEHGTFTARHRFNVHVPESTQHGISEVKGGVLVHHPTTCLLTLKFLTSLAKFTSYN
jgi:hypothetical protein